jgi:dTMP kinase
VAGVKGKLISIEGVDGCGKSTHARLLAEWLRSRGYKVLVTDEPTDGPIGLIIKTTLRGRVKLPATVEALLFAADRAQHTEELIRPALRAGKVVITERYTCSSLAYQSARGLPLTWIETINKRAIRPNLTILIDLPVREALGRIERKRRLDLFERDMGLQQRVRQIYLRIARQKGLKVVDGARPVDEVQADVRKLVAKVL